MKTAVSPSPPASSASSPHLQPASLFLPPGPEAISGLDWRMMLLLRESLHQR